MIIEIHGAPSGLKKIHIRILAILFLKDHKKSAELPLQNLLVAIQKHFRKDYGPRSLAEALDELVHYELINVLTYRSTGDRTRFYEGTHRACTLMAHIRRDQPDLLAVSTSPNV